MVNNKTNGRQLNLGTAIQVGAIMVVLAFVSWLWSNFTAQIDAKVEPLRTELSRLRIDMEKHHGAEGHPGSMAVIAAIRSEMSAIEQRSGDLGVQVEHERIRSEEERRLLEQLSNRVAHLEPRCKRP